MRADPLYELSEVVILVCLLGLMLAANEVGYRVGRSRRPPAPEQVRAQVLAIQTSLLGLFALVLGFTFAMSLSRFDLRKKMVLRESNAIGAVALQANLLPGAERDGVVDLLRRYIDVRLRAAHRTTGGQHSELEREATALEDELCRRVAAVQAGPGAAAAGPLLQAVTRLIEAKRESDAALDNHVPESVLLLLFAFATLAMGIIGFANSLTGVRLAGPVVILSVLVVLLIVVIIDLDRPHRGMIRVRQDSMSGLHHFLDTPRP